MKETQYAVMVDGEEETKTKDERIAGLFLALVDSGMDKNEAAMVAVQVIGPENDIESDGTLH